MSSQAQGRLARMREISETFTPGWAIVGLSTPELKRAYHYAALDLEWREGVPVVFDDGPETPLAVYLSWVKVVLAVSPEGEPVADPALDHSIVTLCDGMGFVLITDGRVLIKLDAGLVLDGDLDDHQHLLLSLKRADVVSLELQSKTKLFGGEKPGPSLVTFSGTSVGAIRFTPKFGANSPYEPQDSGLWGRGAESQLFADLGKGLFDAEHGQPGSALEREEVSPELRAFMHTVKNPFD